MGAGITVVTLMGPSLPVFVERGQAHWKGVTTSGWSCFSSHTHLINKIIAHGYSVVMPCGFITWLYLFI